MLCDIMLRHMLCSDYPVRSALIISIRTIFKLRVSNPRTVAYFHFKAHFEVHFKVHFDFKVHFHFKVHFDFSSKLNFISKFISKLIFISNLPGAGLNFPDWTFENWPRYSVTITTTTWCTTWCVTFTTTTWCTTWCVNFPDWTFENWPYMPTCLDAYLLACLL